MPTCGANMIRASTISEGIVQRMLAKQMYDDQFTTADYQQKLNW